MEGGVPEVSKLLMIFSIGPVQEFIAQARRTRDLWFGSHVLSEMSKAAAIKFQECGGELIFPAFGENTAADELKTLQVANRVVGVIESTEPREVAWQVRRAVTGCWRAHAEEAEKLVSRYINPGIWRRQIGDLIEFYAVWSAFGSLAYSEVLRQTDALMAARKTLRDFRQNEPGRLFGEPKSSLDGGRESVWLPDCYPQLVKYGIKPNETLDAVSAVKRLSLEAQRRKDPQTSASRERPFPSVCDTAFLSFRHLAEQRDDWKESINRYLHDVKQLCTSSDRAFRSADFTVKEARLFYARRIADFVDEHAPEHWEDVVKAGITDEIANRLLRLLQEDIKAQPSPYYAFLVGDGDRMGDQLRNLHSIEAHQQFSQQLSRFSANADAVLEPYKGTLIYSGGDDVMAYLPVHSCLQAAHALRQSFTETMREAVVDFNNPPTLSVGIVIVHMLEPLEGVRGLALEAEREAKRRRNQIALRVQKRGGSDEQRITLAFDHGYDPVSLLSQLSKAFCQRQFSAQLAYALRSLHSEYIRMYGGRATTPARIELPRQIEQDVERLLWKKRTDTVSDKELVELWALMRAVLHQEDEPRDEFSATTNKDTLERLRLLAEYLILAITLEKAGSIDDNPVEDPSH